MRYLWCCAGVHGSQPVGPVPLYHHHIADQASFLLASLAVCATSLASIFGTSMRQPQLLGLLESGASLLRQPVFLNPLFFSCGNNHRTAEYNRGRHFLMSVLIHHWLVMGCTVYGVIPHHWGDLPSHEHRCYHRGPIVLCDSACGRSVSPDHRHLGQSLWV